MFLLKTLNCSVTRSYKHLLFSGCVYLIEMNTTRYLTHCLQTYFSFYSIELMTTFFPLRKISWFDQSLAALNGKALPVMSTKGYVYNSPKL